MHQLVDIDPKWEEESKWIAYDNRVCFEEYIRAHPSTGDATAYADVVEPQAILAAINSLRANPQSYIPHLKQMKECFINDHEYRRGKKVRKLEYGKEQIDETIKFLEKKKPSPPLQIYETIQMATNDHVMDMITNNYFYLYGKKYGGDFGWRIRRRIGYSLDCECLAFYSELFFSEGPDFIKLMLVQQLIDQHHQSKRLRIALLNQRIKYFSGTMMKDPINNNYKCQFILSSMKAVQPKGQPFNNVASEKFTNYKELLQIAARRPVQTRQQFKAVRVNNQGDNLQYRAWVDPSISQSDYAKKARQITKKGKATFDLHIQQLYCPEYLNSFPLFIQTEEILKLLNTARTSPKQIIPLLKGELKLFINNLSFVKNGQTTRTKEGKIPINECIKYLEGFSPINPLELDECLCLAAIDHMMVKVGNYGKDQVDVYERVKRRYGRQYNGSLKMLYLDTRCKQLLNLDVLKEEFLKLIIDSGDKSRPNRSAIFNPSYIAVGACMFRDPAQDYKTVIILSDKHLETVNFEGAYYKIMPKIDPASYLRPPSSKPKSNVSKPSTQTISKTSQFINKKTNNDPYQNDILSTISAEKTPKKTIVSTNYGNMYNSSELNRKKEEIPISDLINYNIRNEEQPNNPEKEIIQKNIRTRTKTKNGVKVVEIIQTIQFADGTMKVKKKET